MGKPEERMILGKLYLQHCRYNHRMDEEIITIEESEARVIGPHDGSDSLYIEMQPSDKADYIRQDVRVVFKGTPYTVSTKAESGDAGGGPQRFVLLKVNEPE